MELHKHVCNLDQAKCLKELGIIQGISPFYWVEWLNRIRYNPGGYKLSQDSYTAFTVAELGAALPDDVRSYRFDDCWQIYHSDEDGMNLFIPENVDTEAGARADFLIYLLETKAITAEEVNIRLEA